MEWTAGESLTVNRDNKSTSVFIILSVRCILHGIIIMNLYMFSIMTPFERGQTLINLIDRHSPLQ